MNFSRLLNTAELTTKEAKAAVKTVVDEYDRIKGKAFREKYDSGKARKYFVGPIELGRDSKAIAKAAYQEHFKEGLDKNKLNGGITEGSAAYVLYCLGFDIWSNELTPPRSLVDSDFIDKKGRQPLPDYALRATPNHSKPQNESRRERSSTSPTLPTRETSDAATSSKPLERKPKDLETKEESDIIVLQEARTAVYRNRHNALTNTFKELLEQSYFLEQGGGQTALFDVLVHKYNKKDDLLIEAKSAIESAHIRMAVGQLFDYWHQAKGTAQPHLALLTPEKPHESSIKMLEWLKIGIMWLENGRLQTCSDNLKHLCCRLAAH